MKFATLRGNGLFANAIFDVTHVANRDNCFFPYAKMREKFSCRGIEIQTSDLMSATPVEFELHQDVQTGSKSENNYLLLMETPQVKPENWSKNAWGRYKKIFTWNDQLVDDRKFVKINFPNKIEYLSVPGFQERDRFCCVIAGNKALVVSSAQNNLYRERVQAIRWFEQNAPEDFDLYGSGWDQPEFKRGAIHKLHRLCFGHFSRLFDLKPFPSSRGLVAAKSTVLRRTRFSLCYENVGGLSGYITEKIFDCFFAGCVPVYWGASNVTEHIPSSCFVDRRNFSDTAEMYVYLKSISVPEYEQYQANIRAFLFSEASWPYGAESFASTIVNTIVSDLDLAQ